MTFLRKLLSWARNSQAERAHRQQAEVVFQAWDEARRSYAERRDRRDTRGQHDAARSVRDAMTARLRARA